LATRRYNAHPQSASGDFYVVHNECVSCGEPHAVAPDLIGWVDAERPHCIWKKQPQTADETEQAIGVIAVSEVGCHRYAGDDPDIIKRIGWDYCDAPRPFQPRAQKNQAPEAPAFRLIQTPPPIFNAISAALRWLLQLIANH
jgi:hypothetical protein